MQALFYISFLGPFSAWEKVKHFDPKKAVVILSVPFLEFSSFL